MARVKALFEKASRKKARRKASHTSTATATVATLCAIGDARKKEHLQSKNTRNSYDGYVRRGKQFLAELVEKQKTSMASGGGGIGIEDVDGEPVDYDELEVAFDNPPNRYSALALELFMVEKCFNQSLGESTGASTYSAFKKYWEMMANEKYRGPYMYDEATHCMSGNPAQSARVQDIRRAIENKCRAGGGSRSHAEVSWF